MLCLLSESRLTNTYAVVQAWAANRVIRLVSESHSVLAIGGTDRCLTRALVWALPNMGSRVIIVAYLTGGLPREQAR